MKKRLDVLLTEKGLFSSREKAKASIMSGIVYVDGILSDKPGMPVSEDSEITIKESLCPYVSRGGLKLEKALDTFSVDLTGKNAIDIGASTGGFTDCMLQRGALHVYCIDVGYGQLDWKLRNDDRVTNIEKCNIRYFDTDIIKEKIDFISIDVSFISLKLVLPVASKLLNSSGDLICLVKPQFEAGRSQVGKKGIVRDPAVHKEVIENVIRYGLENGLYPKGLTYSPITGTKGNIEYLLFFNKQKNSIAPDIDSVVEASREELAR